MSELNERSPLDEALDLFVYAPVGLALTAAEELPKMIERGRDVLGSSVDAARVIGRVAVNQGKVEMSRIASQWNDLGAVLRSGAMSTRPPARRDDAPAARHDATAAPAPTSPAVRPTKRAVPAPANLGISGYESLSASQVVSRLDGLTSEQRAAVKEYESSTRGRRTILGRIAQIESGA
ncbi:MAG TPA: hypothetical protein VMY88_03935 [Acidimicrobiales bacterium]|nr:hypothetical protein [Acidimicrobiales bacterium]